MTAEDPPTDGGSGSKKSGSHRWPLNMAIAALIAVVLVIGTILVVSPGLLSLGDNSASATAQGHYRRTFDEVASPGVIRLAGFPTAASMTLPVPVDAQPSNITIHLDGESQLAVSGQFTLTVFAGGQPVRQIALQPGNTTISSTIDVDPTAISNGSVRLLFKVDGVPTRPKCTLDDRGTGSLVIIKGTSYLGADLAGSITTVRDRMASLFHDVTIYTPVNLADGADAAQWYETAQNLGIALTQTGYQVRYAALPTRDTDIEPNGSILIGSLAALKQAGWRTTSTKPSAIVVGKVASAAVLAVTAPMPLAGVYLTSPALAAGDSPSGWARQLTLTGSAPNRVSLDTLGITTTPLQIADSHTWNINYSLADMPAGRVPARFAAYFSTPSGLTGWNWQVTVTLNNRVLYDGPLASGVHQAVVVDLPASGQRLQNGLSVTVQRDRITGGCDQRTTPYTVQLEPGSGFVVGGAGDPGELVNAPSHLQHTDSVVVQASAARESQNALTATVPTLAAVLPVGAAPTVSIGDVAPTKGSSILVAAGQVRALDPALRSQLPATTAELLGHLLDLGGLQNSLLTVPSSTAHSYTLILSFVGLVTDQGGVDFGAERAKVSTVNGPVFVLDRFGHVIQAVIAHAASSD